MVTFAVNNQSSLEERFAASRQLERMPIDPRMWSETTGEGADQPPPRAGYSLQDRPAPATDGLTREQIPLILGMALLFGRQTDRGERLELIVPRSDVCSLREPN